MAVEAWLDEDDRGAAGRIWAADGRWWRRIVAAGIGHPQNPGSSPPAAMAAGLGEGDGAPYGCSGGA
ncbi:hypothetical protein ACLOJK_004619 [Asimina triloba]